MTRKDLEELYAQAGGVLDDETPRVIETEVFATSNETPYLKKPGVAMVARTQYEALGLGPFLGGFPTHLVDFDYGYDEPYLDDGAQLAKFAGQLCYLSLGEKRTRNADAEKYFENILSSGHGSVLEHMQFSFLLWGISRSQTHELVRHRAGCAFSQVSQRYVSGKFLRFVERPEWQANADLHQHFEQRIDAATRQYNYLAEVLIASQREGDQLLSGDAATEMRKKVNQAARACLPNETEAPILFSANGRALRHVIGMRASKFAEVEIRELFHRVFLCAALAEPLLFLDAESVSLPDGTRAVEFKYPKV